MAATKQCVAWGYLESLNSDGSSLTLGNLGTTEPVKLGNGGCGFALFISEKGKLYSMGEANNYLQRGPTAGSGVACEVALPDNPTIQATAAGPSHCLAVTEQGEVLAWGWRGAVSPEPRKEPLSRISSHGIWTNQSQELILSSEGRRGPETSKRRWLLQLPPPKMLPRSDENEKPERAYGTDNYCSDVSAGLGGSRQEGGQPQGCSADMTNLETVHKEGSSRNDFIPAEKGLQLKQPLEEREVKRMEEALREGTPREGGNGRADEVGPKGGRTILGGDMATGMDDRHESWARNTNAGTDSVAQQRRSQALGTSILLEGFDVNAPECTGTICCGVNDGKDGEGKGGKALMARPCERPKGEEKGGVVLKSHGSARSDREAADLSTNAAAQVPTPRGSEEDRAFKSGTRHERQGSFPTGWTVWPPQRILFLPGVRIRLVAAGACHSLAVTGM
eukprot:TRINITY_DN10964_c0_g1_i1.p1 TRINITY_DN10964_c0_g1~~TRINITY_DN10964_c0_g1_i1.p1  ORF type:complete len:449 (+),score=56.78 TRINITY_DN10964_c0_g1_i1:551-1897(+)